MSKPREEINHKDYFKEIHFLYEIFNDLKNVEEIKLFLKDILTSSELRMLKRRWHIAILLSEGNDIRRVATIAKASTQTVSKIKRIFEEGHGGLLLALKRGNNVKKKESDDFLKSKIPVRGSTFVKNWFR